MSEILLKRENEPLFTDWNNSKPRQSYGGHVAIAWPFNFVEWLKPTGEFLKGDFIHIEYWYPLVIISPNRLNGIIVQIISELLLPCYFWELQKQ